MFKRIFLILLLAATFVSVANAQEFDVINIGMVIDGSSVMTDDIVSLVKEEILTLTKDEFDIQFPDDKILIGDWTLETSRKGISQLLKDSDVDILLTLGAISTSL